MSNKQAGSSWRATRSAAAASEQAQPDNDEGGS